MHTHYCCLLSLIICSFPLKTSWTYGPPETCSFSPLHSLSPHPQCGPTGLLDFNDQCSRFSVTHQWLSFFSCLFNPVFLPPPLHHFPSLCSLCKKRGRTSAVCATPRLHPSPAGPPRCRASGFGSGRVPFAFCAAMCARAVIVFLDQIPKLRSQLDFLRGLG